MAILTIMLIASISISSVYAFFNPEFAEANTFDINQIKTKKQYGRIITSAFIHKDIPHLFFNMFTLYSFAQYMEVEYSSLIIFASFFLSVIGGNLFSLFKNRKNNNYRAIGASGGVCGIIYSSLILMEGGNIYLMFIPVPVPDRVYAVSFVLVSYYLMKKGADNIGHDAHLGGAFTGTVFAICIIPWIIRQEYMLIISMFIPFVAILIYEALTRRNALKRNRE